MREKIKEMNKQRFSAYSLLLVTALVVLAVLLLAMSTDSLGLGVGKI